ncbi:hypothetical protein ACGFNU_38140 [Spirillospora sp. NPDC048911]|uniref:hypothetical protein n=1 Tax=Spirillospora sp. NPDC048911 TaxID=3364527 RepID=UPI00371A87E8
MPDGDEAPFLGEFSQRLHSGDLGVVCDALSDYQQAQADTRWGVDNPYWPLNNEVLFVARDLLDRSSRLDDENRHRALSWSLTMVWHLGEEADADRISREYGPRAAHLTALSALRIAAKDDLSVLADSLVSAGSLRDQVLDTVRDVLWSVDHSHPRLVQALGDIVCDEAVPTSERSQALYLLGEFRSDNSIDVLLNATRCPELEIQAAAALILARDETFEEHRPMIAALTASWPAEEVPTEVIEVRELLEDSDEE